MAQIILNPVRVATTTDLNFALTNSRIIDGISVVSGNRVLVKNQNNSSQNGIYEVQGDNTLVRSADFPTGVLTNGTYIVFIEEGDKYAESGWVLEQNNNINIDSTGLTFKRFTINLSATDLVGSAVEQIVLRKDKGSPLTNNELDNNFIYLSTAVDAKVRIEDYTPINVIRKITEGGVSTEDAAIDVWTVRGLSPVLSVDNILNKSRIVVANNEGTVPAIKFQGPLEGNADTATRADSAAEADTLSQVLVVDLGGTGADNAVQAAENLNVVKRSGDTVTGRLVLSQPSGEDQIALLRLGTSNPDSSVLSTGDIWIASDGFLRYRSSSTNHTLARLNSPIFTGAPSLSADAAPTTASSHRRIADVGLVVGVRDALQTSINLKANIASPALTGTPTSTTPLITDTDGTRIATLGLVKSVRDGLQDNIDLKANIDSPTLTGAPRAPTPLITEGTRIATAKLVEDTRDDLEDKINLKADTATVNEQLALKADTITVNESIALKANKHSPTLTGEPKATTPGIDDGTRIATAALVKSVRDDLEDKIDLKANINSPTLTGQPNAPTPGIDDGTRIATAALVKSVRDDLQVDINVKADINSPTLTGTPKAPTPLITDGTRIATAELVKSVRDALQADINVKVNTTAVNADLSLKANIDSPTLTGQPNAPTPGIDDGTRIATAELVKAIRDALQADINLKANTTTVNADLSLKADKNSPVLTGTPKAPTPSITDTDGTRIATLGLVKTTKADIDTRIAGLADIYQTKVQAALDQPKWGTSRKFVQSDTPTGAVDGDFWFKI